MQAMTQSRSFRLASSEFPSGVAWLLNFLVELDVLIYNTSTIEDTWAKQADGSYALTESEAVTKKYVPALSDSSVRKFRDDFVVRWSHEFPVEKCKEEKVILLVRDGRDAVHSLFKRKNNIIDRWSQEYFIKQHREASFQDWLHSEYGPTRLTPAEIWALFHYLWIVHTPAQDLLIIRFDDLKTDPETTVAKVLSFMNLAPDQPTIARAIASSSFERTKKAEERYKQEHLDHHNVMIRRGALKEWPGVYGRSELKTFEGFPAVLLALFGYEVSEQKNRGNKPMWEAEVSEWNQSTVPGHISVLNMQYRQAPRLEKYWRRYKRREFLIAFRGKMIAFLKRGRGIMLYAIIKTAVDIYRAARKR